MLLLPSETLENIKPQDDHKRPTQVEKRRKKVIRFYYLSPILGSRLHRGRGVGTPGLLTPAILVLPRRDYLKFVATELLKLRLEFIGTTTNKAKMTDMKYSTFNSSETGQTFSSLIMTNCCSLLVSKFFCAQAIYCVFLLFTNRYRTAARPRFNKARNIIDRDCVDRVDIGDLSENTPSRRRLNFGTSDDTFNTQSNTLESPSLAGPRATKRPSPA